MNIVKIWPLFIFLLPGGVWAEKADRTQPVYLSADSSRLDDVQKTSVYEGKVVLTRGSMQIEADRIEVHQDAGGFQSGQAYGKPAYFRQKEEGTGTVIEGWANRLDYDGNAEVVKLIGQARLKRGNEQEVHGNEITYQVQKQIYQAQSSPATSTQGSGRVIAVIQPKPDAKPATKPGAKIEPAVKAVP